MIWLSLTAFVELIHTEFFFYSFRFMLDDLTKRWEPWVERKSIKLAVVITERNWMNSISISVVHGKFKWFRLTAVPNINCTKVWLLRDDKEYENSLPNKIDTRTSQIAFGIKSSRRNTEHFLLDALTPRCSGTTKLRSYFLIHTTLKRKTGNCTHESLNVNKHKVSASQMW